MNQEFVLPLEIAKFLGSIKAIKDCSITLQISVSHNMLALPFVSAYATIKINNGTKDKFYSDLREILMAMQDWY